MKKLTLLCGDVILSGDSEYNHKKILFTKG